MFTVQRTIKRYKAKTNGSVTFVTFSEVNEKNVTE
jgi:hypothetical protein